MPESSRSKFTNSQHWVENDPIYLQKLFQHIYDTYQINFRNQGNHRRPCRGQSNSLDAVKFAASYGTWLKDYSQKEKLNVVIGRDARLSGEMIQNLVVSTLVGLGIDVIDLGLSTTPTVEIAVPLEKADGGIILTASHNPKQWNALKLLNERGEFLNAQEGAKILELAEREDFEFAEVDNLGTIIKNDSYMDVHVDEVLKLSLVDAEVIQKKKFKVVVDGVNSTGESPSQIA